MLQTFDNKNVQNWQLDSTDPERVYGFEKIMPDFALDPFVVMQSAIKASDNGFFSDRPNAQSFVDGIAGQVGNPIHPVDTVFFNMPVCNMDVIDVGYADSVWEGQYSK